jgi:ubiquitin-like protein Nedd8
LLSTRGWCFIKFEEKAKKSFDDLFSAASSFLASPEQSRERFLYEKSFGYITAKTKHGFHALTGRRLEEIPVPPTMYGHLRSLSVLIDTYAKKLIEVAGSDLFKNNKNYQQEALKKLPLVQPYVNGGAKSEYGMLDIMEYFVPSTTDANGESSTAVSEHGDPGLFSFSFKSNAPGLSMLDPVTTTWVPVPPESSVMWCGSAAEELSQGQLKVGWHRVDKTFVKPRLTMWYEVCTYEQVPLRFLNKDIEPTAEEAFKLPVTSYGMVHVRTLTGKVIDFPNTLSSNNKVEDLQQLIQDREGIPPSKQRLVHMARILVSERTLGFYGYESGQMIHLVLSLRG